LLRQAKIPQIQQKGALVSCEKFAS